MTTIEKPEGYQDWFQRVVAGREARGLSEGEIVKSSAGTLIPFIEFAAVKRDRYYAEVGKKDSDIIFHFYPPTWDGDVAKLPLLEPFPSSFEDSLGSAFLAVFKFPDRLRAAFVPELNSWALKLIGYADNPSINELAAKALSELDRLME